MPAMPVMPARRLFIQLLLLIGLIAPVAPAMAWSADGHQLICALAETKLTEEGKAFLTEKLKQGFLLDANASTDFAKACLWADDARSDAYKGTYEQHFLNVPRGATEINFSRDCAALDCIAVGLQRNLVYLAQTPDGNRQLARQAAAIRFLGHFVGDLHQPMHVSYGDDWGGNKLKVKVGREDSNLHGVWDYHAVVRAGLSYPDSIDFLKTVALENTSNNPLRWLQDSLELAITVGYLNTADRPIVNGEEINDAYFERAKPVVIRQMVLAADRLAYLINHLADGSLDPNILMD